LFGHRSIETICESTSILNDIKSLVGQTCKFRLKTQMDQLFSS